MPALSTIAERPRRLLSKNSHEHWWFAQRRTRSRCFPVDKSPADAQHPRMMDPKARRLIWAHIQVLAETAGVAMRAPEVLANSHLALQAAEFARENGKGDTFDERVYKAYFTEGLNIGLQGVLGDLATDVGLERSAQDSALESQRYAPRLERDAQLAHQRGVSGVPAFFLGEYSLRSEGHTSELQSPVH